MCEFLLCLLLCLLAGLFSYLTDLALREGKKENCEDNRPVFNKEKGKKRKNLLTVKGVYGNIRKLSGRAAARPGRKGPEERG